MDDPTSNAYVYAFYRYYVGSIVFLFLLIKKNIRLSFELPLPVFMRGITNGIAVIFFYLAIEWGETGRANVLNMTYPAFVALISGPLIREYPDFRTILSLILCIIGIFFYFIEPLLKLAHEILISDIFALLSSITAAFSIVSLRSSAKIAPTEYILFWMFFLGVFITLPFCYKNLFLLDKSDLVYLLVSAVMGVLGQWFLTISYRYLDATTGSIVSGSRIPIALLFGFFFLGEPFSFFAWMGGLLIFTSNILIALKHEFK